MVDDGIDKFIPGKPHDYGCFAHTMAQQMLFTSLSLLVDFEPQLPHNKPTPQQALLKMTQRIQQSTTHQLHIVADSNFVAAGSLEEFKHLKSRATIAINNGSSSGFQDLYQIGSSDLPPGSARTYPNGSLHSSIVSKGESCYCSCQQAWTLQPTQQISPSPLFEIFNSCLSLQRGTIINHQKGV